MLTVKGQTDSGQVTTQTLNIYVNEHGVEKTLVKKFNGKILGFDGERTLIVDEIPYQGNTYHQLHIANLSTDDIDDIKVPTGNRLLSSGNSLTPTGAIFRTEYYSSYQWHNKELFPFGIVSIVEGSGDYLAFCDNDTLYRRTTSTNSNLAIKTVRSCDYTVASNSND